MTKYQVVSDRANREGRIKIGEPHESMMMAELHAMELRDLLHARRDTEAVVSVELVDVP